MDGIELRIDPEFQNLLPPLTDEEFDQLRENIVHDGRVMVPLIVWDGIIVDGHHRWKIIQENPGIPYEISEMEFANKWEVIDWMIVHQRGQRNLTEAQRTYLLGKLYEARKHTVGNPNKRNDDGTFQCSQIGDNGEPNRISEQIAEEFGVGKNTVLRAGNYATGIESIREKTPEVADAILTGKLTPKKKDVMAVGSAEVGEREDMISQIASGKKIIEPPKIQIPDKIAANVKADYNGGGTKEYRDERKGIAEIVSSMYGKTPMKYTLKDLMDEILWNAEDYIRKLNNEINDHPQIVEAYKSEIREHIEKNVIAKIEEIKDGI